MLLFDLEKGVVVVRRESRPDAGRDVRHGRFESSVCERLVVEGEAREGDVAPDRLPLPLLVVVEAPAAILRSQITLFWKL